MARFLGSCSLKLSAFILGAALSAQAFGQAQPGQPTQPGGNAGASDNPQQRMEAFRKQITDRMKTLLQASDDEFAVLQPRIEKIQQLQTSNDSRRAGFGMLMGNNAWRNRPSTPATDAPKPDAAKPDAAKPADNANRFNPFGNLQTTPAYEKAQALQEALESKEATPDTLKAKLAELRAAKLAAKAEVSRAQEELRSLCSVRQEAVLVMVGILE